MYLFGLFLRAGGDLPEFSFLYGAGAFQFGIAQVDQSGIDQVFGYAFFT